MNPACSVTVWFYGGGYTAASWAGIDAAFAGHGWYAVALITAAAALLVALHREYRHAAGQAAPAYATALPAGCNCELWWTTLGADHDAYCASARKANP